jgi:hypothetical protein
MKSTNPFGVRLPGRFRRKMEMKMDPHTAILAAAFALGFSGMSEPVPAFYGCEVEPIAGTNAYQYADPTCASAVTQNTTDYETIMVGHVEVTVPVNNK